LLGNVIRLKSSDNNFIILFDLRLGFQLKFLYIFVFTVLYFFNCCYADEIQNIYVSTSYRPALDTLEELFKENLDIKKGIIYTKVPRGLVISIHEDYFFNNGDARIKESSLSTLAIIARVLNSIPNRCVIEDHTEGNDLTCTKFTYEYELSIARAANIVNYMLKCENLPWIKAFGIGYGEFMPFRDNVSSKGPMMDKRVDFVIIEYSTTR